MTTALLLKIGADASAMRGELNKANSLVTKFTNQLSGVAGAMVGAFSAQLVADFVMEVSKLSAEAEGVRNAFNKLPSSVKLMADLKEATAGTVSELDLMKRAVMAQNFNISLAELPKLLNFATLRAQQTGQSVDYLVDSIVTGLGRKSVLILDNLGISAAALSEEVAKSGDFMKAAGTIVDQELGKMGPLLETAITSTDRLKASYTNLKVAFGDAANSGGLMSKTIDALSTSMDLLASKNLTFWQKLAAMVGGSGAAANAWIQNYTAEVKRQLEEQKKNEQVIREVDRAFVEFNKNIDAYAKAISTHIYKTELLAEFTKRLKKEEEERAGKIENIKNLTDQLNSKQEMAQVLTGTALAQTNREIQLLEEKIKTLRELGKLNGGPAFKAVEMPGISGPSTNASDYGFMGTNSAEIEATAQATYNYINELEQETADKVPLIKGRFLELGSAIEMSMETMAMSFGSAIGDMLTGIGGIEQLAGAVVGSFGAMAVQLGQTMIQFGIAGIALKKFIANPALAIAAGVALVALGKALSNKAASITSGGGGGGSANTNRETLSRKIEYGNRIEVTGEFELRGDTAVALIKNQQRRDNRTLPRS